jgi:hypothetical protein
MNLSQLRTPAPPYWGANVLSRRRFLRSAAGAAGVILGSNLLPQARADGSDPPPIPGGNYFLGFPGPLFHVFAPGLGTFPVDQVPITITNFNGFIGLAYISGMATEKNTTTGAQRKLPFNMADMRFMHGVFRDQSEQVRQGTFALV